MDYLLGGLINDFVLYKIIEGLMAILSMAVVYLGIQIALNWKFVDKKNLSLDQSEILSGKQVFNRSTIFIFIAGFFMLIHEFLEGLNKSAPDYVTYELLELIALSGLVLFLYEWHKIMVLLKKKDFGK